MKKILMVALVVAVGVSLGSMGYKAWAVGSGVRTAGQVDVQALKSFQKETLPLRDELMAKGAELQNEFAKESPDQNMIAALQKEMIDLRTKIQDAAQKAGLSGRGGWGRGYGMGPGYGPGFMMGGGYGRSYQGGDDDDYGCPMW
jgi:zinc resistance-associated protein